MTPRLPLFTLPVFASAALLAPAIGRCDTTSTITAIADTFVASSTPNGNFGGAGAMQLAPASAPKGSMESLLKFDLSGTVATFNATYGVGGWTIQSATLSLGTNFGTAGTQPNNPIFNPIATGNFGVQLMANNGWQEGTGSPSNPTTDGVTFNTLPNFVSAANDHALGTFAFTAPGNNTVSTYGLGLDPSFVSDLDAGGPVSLHLLAADNQVSYLFNSRTYGTAAQRPMLILDAAAVPEPAPAAFLAVAGMALAFAGVKRWHRPRA